MGQNCQNDHTIFKGNEIISGRFIHTNNINSYIQYFIIQWVFSNYYNLNIFLLAKSVFQFFDFDKKTIKIILYITNKGKYLKIPFIELSYFSVCEVKKSIC